MQDLWSDVILISNIASGLMEHGPTVSRLYQTNSNAAFLRLTLTCTSEYIKELFSVNLMSIVAIKESDIDIAPYYKAGLIYNLTANWPKIRAGQCKLPPSYYYYYTFIY